MIHHGVDRRQFHAGVRSQHRAAARAELGIAESEVVFLFVGDARKGAVQTMEALGKIPGRLVIVTRSDHGPLKEAARAAGVETRVVLAPPTDRIERFYGAADVFVLPTPYDAFGMVVTEAMACGLPVITTTAAGASEVVADGRTGILLEDVADGEALANAMRRFAEDASFRRDAGAAAAQAMLDLVLGCGRHQDHGGVPGIGRRPGRAMIAFVVNGDEQSAMAMRAQAFARHLARRWPIEVGYRRKGRVGSIPQLAWWLARQRPDAIWVFDMALSGVVAGTLVKPGGARLIIDTGDVIAELARQSRLRGRLGVLATSGLERLAEAAADALIVRGTAHAELYAERGIPTTLIPDGVEVDQFAGVGRREATRHSLGVTDELVVGLVGSTVWSPSLGLTYGWDLVEALGQLRDLPVVGLIVGDGSGIPHLRERARALDVDRPPAFCRPTAVRHAARLVVGVRRVPVDANQRPGRSGPHDREAAAVHGQRPLRAGKPRGRSQARPARPDVDRLRRHRGPRLSRAPRLPNSHSVRGA